MAKNSKKVAPVLIASIQAIGARVPGKKKGHSDRMGKVGKRIEAMWRPVEESEIDSQRARELGRTAKTHAKASSSEPKTPRVKRYAKSAGSNARAAAGHHVKAAGKAKGTNQKHHIQAAKGYLRLARKMGSKRRPTNESMYDNPPVKNQVIDPHFDHPTVDAMDDNSPVRKLEKDLNMYAARRQLWAAQKTDGILRDVHAQQAEKLTRKALAYARHSDGNQDVTENSPTYKAFAKTASRLHQIAKHAGNPASAAINYKAAAKAHSRAALNSTGDRVYQHMNAATGALARAATLEDPKKDEGEECCAGCKAGGGSCGGEHPTNDQASKVLLSKKDGGKSPKMDEKTLDAADRKEMPKSQFVFPKTKRYPVEDEAHARAALSRVAADGSPAEQAMVRKVVRDKFPHIDVKTEGTMGAMVGGAAGGALAGPLGAAAGNYLGDKLGDYVDGAGEDELPSGKGGESGGAGAGKEESKKKGKKDENSLAGAALGGPTGGMGGSVTGVPMTTDEEMTGPDKRKASLDLALKSSSFAKRAASLGDALSAARGHVDAAMHHRHTAGQSGANPVGQKRHMMAALAHVFRAKNVGR